MAVKQHPTDSPQQSTSTTPDNVLTDITNFLNYLKVINESLDWSTSPVDLLRTWEHIIMLLGKVSIPRDINLIKVFRESISNVKEFLVTFSKTDQYQEVYEPCLRFVYKEIVSNTKVSGAISIVLDIYEEPVISKAVNWMFSMPDSDKTVKRAMIVLCTWLHTYNFTKNLNVWIIEIIKGLRERQKKQLLLEIGSEVVLPLMHMLPIPFFRPHVAPVLFFILLSVPQSPELLQKILPHFPKLANTLCNHVKNDSTTQQFIDTVAALVCHFRNCVQINEETENILRKYQPTKEFANLMGGQLYQKDDSHLEVVNSNARVGLVNLGNTCYMNSVLQALVMTKQFSRELLLSTSRGPLHQKIQELLALLLHSLRPELTPRSVLQAARPPTFHPGHQQDSSEFLGHLLEALHEEEAKTSPSSVRTELTESKMLIDGGDITENDCSMMPHNKPVMKSRTDKVEISTLIQRSFGGELRIIYKCMVCGGESQHIDHFRDLPLAFPINESSETKFSVQDLVNYYCAPDKLIGDNQYFCEKCDELCDGEQYFSFIKTPKNLIVTLKHFKYDVKFNTRAKLMNNVDHDEFIRVKVLETIGLSEKIVTYRLYAAVVHSGVSMDSGHYYTYAADNPNCWYKFNDSYVTQSSLTELRDLEPPNTPYILFYRLMDGIDDELIQDSHESSAQNVTPRTSPNRSLELKSYCDFPSLDELPPYLRDYVNRDNISYREELAMQRQKSRSNIDTIANNNRNNQNDSDSDDPPSSCGGQDPIRYNNQFIC